MLTTSIRRKLIFGLGLVTLILVVLLAGGVYVLTSYEQVVADLDQVVTDVPRRDEMLDAVVSLRGHLRASLAQQKEWSPRVFVRRFSAIQQDFDTLHKTALEFRRRLSNLENRAPDAHAKVVGSLLYGIELKIAAFRKSLDGVAVEGEIKRDAIASLQLSLDDLFDSIWKLEEPTGNLHTSVHKAHTVYETGIDALIFATIFSGIVLVWLTRCGYRWLFRPVRELYEGTSRVAQGDFDYRIQLDQQDEMGELAQSFNKMTQRFQEITDDLDRQVRERVNQLVRSERLASIGMLAAGVAHEINTPLSSISIAAESILSRKHEIFGHLSEEDQEDLSDYFDILRTEPQQCRSITQRLLAFSRGEGNERVEFNLTEVIHEVLNMVGHLGKFRAYKIQFERTEPCQIEANRSEIKQVILNLAANGLESMEEGGTLKVELIEATDQVELRVSDEGYGMTPETMEHLFEPFFTQNKPGQGTGLGLAITHRIITDHGGTIEPQSGGADAGSVFHVHLPKKARQQRAA